MTSFLRDAMLVLMRQLGLQVLVSHMVHKKIQKSLKILYNCMLGIFPVHHLLPPLFTGIDLEA